MPVTPSRTHLLPDRRELYQFLSTCQAVALEKAHPQIASLSIKVDLVDPLAALAVLHSAPDTLGRAGRGTQSHRKVAPLHFYLERPDQEEAIAGFDPIIQLQTEGSQRFVQAKQFINSSLVDTIAAGAVNLPFAGPHFFCSFTFFDHNLDTDAPFAAATVFLPRWQIARCQDQSVVVANLPIDAESDLEPLVETVWQNLHRLITLPPFPRQRREAQAIRFLEQNVQSIDHFQATIQAALKSIHAQQLEKIVLAHAVDITASHPFDLFQSLANLRDRYPKCYVFSISNGQGQTFIGASPEQLVGVHDQELITDALAGSAPRSPNFLEDTSLADRLLHSEKDLREHQVVIDFIVQCLENLQMTPQVLPSPHLLQLPNIQHLQTLIRARVPAHLHLLDILAQLHPTPAVAGAPREIAYQEMRRYEQFERHLYAAPLGWVDHQGNGKFVVGIRSALMAGNCTRLFAGAGIVAGSDPEKELAEIRLKLQTLRDVLG